MTLAAQKKLTRREATMEPTSLRRPVDPQPAPQGQNEFDQFRLFEAETVVFDKFDEVVRRKQHLEAEKNLMLAILEEGISCLPRNIRGRRDSPAPAGVVLRLHRRELW